MPDDLIRKGVTIVSTTTFYKPDAPAHHFAESTIADLMEVIAEGMTAKGYEVGEMNVKELVGREGAK
jgi:hypothetical protein